MKQRATAGSSVLLLMLVAVGAPAMSAAASVGRNLQAASPAPSPAPARSPSPSPAPSPAPAPSPSPAPAPSPSPAPAPPLPFCIVMGMHEDPFQAEGDDAASSFAFTLGFCSEFADFSTTQMSFAASAANATLSKPFVLAPGAEGCSCHSVRVCGELASADQAEALQEQIRWMDLTSQLAAMGATSQCSLATAGTEFMAALEVPQGYEDVLSAASAMHCDVFITQPTTFPTTQCADRKAITPFSVGPSITSLKGRKRGATWYCWSLQAGEADNQGACGLTTSLMRLEVYANASRKGQVTGVMLRLNNGTQRIFSPVWGGAHSPEGPNSLRATNLKLSVQQVQDLQPQVCFEISFYAQLKDICLGSEDEGGSGGSGGAVCWVALHDPTSNCCPVYAAQQALPQDGQPAPC